MVDFLLEQLDDPAVSARAMFGGYGVYRAGCMFAIVYDDVIYMKVSEAEARTCERPPFRPRAKQTLWSFREVFADELEDQQNLREVAARAQRAAGR